MCGWSCIGVPLGHEQTMLDAMVWVLVLKIGIGQVNVSKWLVMHMATNLDVHEFLEVFGNVNS
jgi:hypothetical protein